MATSLPLPASRPQITPPFPSYNVPSFQETPPFPALPSAPGCSPPRTAQHSAWVPIRRRPEPGLLGPRKLPAALLLQPGPPAPSSPRPALHARLPGVTPCMGTQIRTLPLNNLRCRGLAEAMLRKEETIFTWATGKGVPWPALMAAFCVTSHNPSEVGFSSLQKPRPTVS